MIDVLCYLLRAICWKREGAICIFVRGCGYVTWVFFVAVVLLLYAVIQRATCEAGSTRKSRQSAPELSAYIGIRND